MTCEWRSADLRRPSRYDESVDPPPAALVAARLAEASIVLAHSQVLREPAVELRRQARVLRARARRWLPVSGGSDGRGREQLRRTFAAFVGPAPVKTHVGASRGATCGVCGVHIVAGDLEYEIVGERREIRLDRSCYLILLDEVARVPPEV